MLTKEIWELSGAKSGELNCSDLRREQELIKFICLDVPLVKDRCSLFPYISRNSIGKVSIQRLVDYLSIEINMIWGAIFKSILIYLYTYILIINKWPEDFYSIWICVINSKSKIDFCFFGCAFEYRCELARVIVKTCLIATFIDEKPRFR